MRSRTIVILVIIVALLIAATYGWKEYHRGTKSLTEVNADYTVSAETFINEFEKSDTVTEKKYLGKVIQVTGAVKQVEKDGGTYTIVIGTPTAMSAVRCAMDSTINDQLGAIRDGDQLTVKGNFTGYQKDETGLLGSDIKLNRAVPVK